MTSRDPKGAVRQAIRSAILATAWLLVNELTFFSHFYGQKEVPRELTYSNALCND